MKKNSLTINKGLSLSQAQSVSNLCNQRAGEIQNIFDGVNNYSKTVTIVDGKGGSKTHTILTGKKLPTDIVARIVEKAELHACQAFLMENIKAKDQLLKDIKKESADISSLETPQRPEMFSAKSKQLPEVGEDYGWSQLSTTEINEFIEAEAFAAHIGQFIHSGSPLDRLRRELPSIPAIEWMTINDGVKSPVTIDVHHNSVDLLKVHEELAAQHRAKEQRVNYFKAKVKNLTTEENSRIAKHNADMQNEVSTLNNQNQTAYDTAFRAYTEACKNIIAEFEKTRQARIKEVAAMRIEVDARFQKTVDTFLKQLSDTQE